MRGVSKKGCPENVVLLVCSFRCGIRRGKPAIVLVQERVIEGAGVKRGFKVGAGRASHVTQPRAVAKGILAVAAQLGA